PTLNPPPPSAASSSWRLSGSVTTILAPTTGIPVSPSLTAPTTVPTFGNASSSQMTLMTVLPPTPVLAATPPGVETAGVTGAPGAAGAGGGGAWPGGGTVATHWPSR